MRDLVLFMPSIEVGGVEKNLFIIANYLVRKGIKVKLITSSKKYTKKLNINIKIISINNNFFLKRKKYVKFFFCLILLFLEHDLVVFWCDRNVKCRFVGDQILNSAHRQ